MAFCVPVTPPRPAVELSPKFENNTLPSERFMAFAISWVSRVPAAPTTVPAMIMAALSSTKPSKPTARPVSALYSEITTGMSAPPIGSVIAMPSSSANTKNSETTRQIRAADAGDHHHAERDGDEQYRQIQEPSGRRSASIW